MTAAVDVAERNKAFRIRRKQEGGKKLTDDEKAFLESYPTRGRSASATERITHIEERHAAEAEGEHPHPDAYADLAMTEGLRADTLLRISTRALRDACDLYRQMAQQSMERLKVVEDAHVAMLMAVRDSHLLRAEAEGHALLMEQLVEKLQSGGAEGDDFTQFMELFKTAIELKNSGKGKGQVKKKAATAG